MCFLSGAPLTPLQEGVGVLTLEDLKEGVDESAVLP